VELSCVVLYWLFVSLSLRSVLLRLSQLVRAQRFLGRANRSLILGTKATSHLHRSINMKAKQLDVFAHIFTFASQG
jgi:hypothetical protein